MPSAPKILVFDSGLGGLTVFRALAARRPDADYFYVADDLGFPYGPRPETEVIALVMSAMERLMAEIAPDGVVIACNTASTIVLPDLRARWPEIPFVGTVPAIKPAAKISASRVIAVLATPGTVARDYTQELIQNFAGDCEVVLVGSKILAERAERFMLGEAVDEAEIFREIAPCFVAHDGRRTDAVALACTHYPLLLDFFEKLAPWPVRFIDPAPAIARRADQLLTEKFPLGPARDAAFRFIFTSGAAPGPKLSHTVARLREKIALEQKTAIADSRG